MRFPYVYARSDADHRDPRVGERDQPAAIVKGDRGLELASPGHQSLTETRRCAPRTAGIRHPSGTPALRIPSQARSRWARKIGFLFGTPARNRAMVNVASKARPA